MKCIICKRTMYTRVGEFNTCNICLEEMIVAQGHMIAKMTNQINGLFESADITSAQLDHVLGLIAAKVSSEEYRQMLQKIVTNPFALEDKDIC